ncbi:MAG TPA: glycoside hydrolase family 15 protein [Mycobacteriales bacterium]|jgi:Glucoamylase and related glycosyl hydrolases
MSDLPTVQAGREALARDPLARTGLRVLVAGQAPTGALVAAPTFPTYRFGWLRDGAFCALALDVVGRVAEARAFHHWVAETILSHRRLVDTAIGAVREGQLNPPHLPTRYTLSGELEPESDRPWPTFQLDGYGTWLYALARHVGRSDPPENLRTAAGLVGRYLSALWQVPCHDCWEEPGDGHHTSTLLAIASGLSAAAHLLGTGGAAEAERVTDQIRAELVDRHTTRDRLTKSRTDRRVDASLLWAGAPLELPGITDTDLRPATVEAIRSELLLPGGGVRRYLGDRYYGGGEWLLATSWLGWQAVLDDDRELAEHCDHWVREQSTADGLPEQVTRRPQFPDLVPDWVRRRGTVATPLLWSHAMQIIHSAAMVQADWPVGHGTD